MREFDYRDLTQAEIGGIDLIYNDVKNGNTNSSTPRLLSRMVISLRERFVRLTAYTKQLDRLRYLCHQMYMTENPPEICEIMECLEELDKWVEQHQNTTT